MKLNKTFLLLFIISFLSFTPHKYYLSLTQINYKTESKSIQIIINVFMDDIETALNKDYAIDLQLTTKKELKNNDVFFKKYLKEKLHFKVDEIAKNFTYIGKEYLIIKNNLSNQRLGIYKILEKRFVKIY